MKAACIMFAPPYIDKPNFAKSRIVGTYMQDDTSCNYHFKNLTENLQLFNLFPTLYFEMLRSLSLPEIYSDCSFSRLMYVSQSLACNLVPHCKQAGRLSSSVLRYFAVPLSLIDAAKIERLFHPHKRF